MAIYLTERRAADSHEPRRQKERKERRSGLHRGERETGEWKNEIRDRKRVKRAEESEQKEKEKERKRGGRERTDEQSERERERTESDTSKWVGRALLDPWHHLQNLALKRKTKHRASIFNTMSMNQKAASRLTRQKILFRTSASLVFI